MRDTEHKDFMDELERRISILTSSEYDDKSLKHLQKQDYFFIVVILILSFIILGIGVM